MTQPLISVIIPAYNEEKEIGKCLDAVLHQTMPRDQYEVLVIDNNSTDKTSEIAKEKGVKVLSYTEKQGITVTKEFGTAHAKGAILAYTDADSRPQKNWLEEGLRLFADPKLMIIGGVVYPHSGSRFTYFLYVIYHYFSLFQQLLGISLLWGSNLIIRKSAYDKIGGFDKRLKVGEDWEIAKRIQDIFGKKSSLYTSRLVVYASPRKQENLKALTIYVYNGFLNYINFYLLGRIRTKGEAITVR